MTATDAPAHLPPQNIDAENAVIGAMIASNAAIEKVCDVGVTGQMFYRPSNQVLFDTITSLEAHGQVDELTVVAELRRTNQLDAAGGTAGVVSLYERTPSAANAKAYAEEVRDQFLLRRLTEVGHEIATLGYERPNEIPKLLAQAAAMVDGLGVTDSSGYGFTTLRDELQAVYERMTDRSLSGQTMLGVSTGFAALDERWCGLQNGRLYIVAGRPGMGKSVLGDQLAENVVFGSDVDTLRINLEMGPAEQANRSMARLARIELRRVANGKPDNADFQPAADAMKRVHSMSHKLHMDTAPSLTVGQIRSRTRRLARQLKKQGRRLGLVTIDYLQLADPEAGTESNEVANLTRITRGLKQLARELDIPVVALSQLNRSVEQRPDKRPQMSDLRGSGSIEQDADVIAFLFRPEYYLGEHTPADQQNRVEIITAKWRDGEPGSDELGFLGSQTRIMDLDQVPPVKFVAGINKEVA